MTNRPSPDQASRTAWGPAPTLDDIAAMAALALAELEEPFREPARAVSIRVEDFADEETLEKMHIGDPWELTGLYSGVALTLELNSAPATIPAVIWLYRMPILDEWMASPDVALEDLVAHVLIHELGHHFGWSDDEMHEALGE
jgi:predicted Zn-dependent protease with MMP-like domain